MRALVVALLLASSPAPLDKARSLAKEKSWVELYLAFSASDPEEFKDAERKELAGLMIKGANALEKNDPVIAFSLAERASAFRESSEALLLVARTGLRSEQRGAAESALRKGLEKYPNDGAFALALGRLLLDEKDPEGARAALEKVPPKSKEAKEARGLLQKARAMIVEEQTAERQARALERRIHGVDGKTEPAVARGPDGEAKPEYTGLTYESGVGPGGMRTRGNSRFVFKYFNNQRDFGQRAEYEGKVAAALEEAYVFTKRVLGSARETPVDVVLYTREEFLTHHGAGMAMSVAGFYSDSAIRMNDAAELNPRTQATLVHEYVHAVVDEVAGGNARAVPMWVNEGIAEYVEWRYQGSENPPLALGSALRGAATRGQLPSLSSMADRSLISQQNPTIAYGTSAMAVKLILKRGGVENFLGLLREVGAGASFDEVFKTRYGRSVARLNEELVDELKTR